MGGCCHLPPHPGSWPRCTVTGGGWWAGDPGWGASPQDTAPKWGGGGRHRTVAKVIVLFWSPWQPLPWTAPHHCLAAVAQATHRLSWLLRLWGTQDLGREGQRWQATGGGYDVPPPQCSCSHCCQFGAGSLLGAKVLLWCCPQAHSQLRCPRAPSETSWDPCAFLGCGSVGGVPLSTHTPPPAVCQPSLLSMPAQ